MGTDDIDVYNTNNIIPVAVSIFIFLMYTITTLIDTNTAVKEFYVGSEPVGAFKFIYAYLAGFFTYFLKITSSLFTLYMLLTLVRIAIVVVFNVFRPLGSPDAAAEFRADIFTKVKHAMKNNGLWIFGLYMLERFLVFFLAYSPLLFVLVLILYAAKIYRSKSLRAMEDQEKVTKAILTMHNQTMFFLVSCILIVLFYFVFTYSQIMRA